MYMCEAFLRAINQLYEFMLMARIIAELRRILCWSRIIDPTCDWNWMTTLSTVYARRGYIFWFLFIPNYFRKLKNLQYQIKTDIVKE